MPYSDREVHRVSNMNRKRYLYIHEPWRAKCWSAREKAKDLGLDYNLDYEYVKNLWPSDNKCPALSIELKQGTKGKPIDSSPSLDRILPELGYIKGNVQIICNLANKIMSSATPDQVMAVAKHYKKITEEKNAA
mgnify:FL=1